jgi:murein L,D-transpeptidase YcbB/YkuD
VRRFGIHICALVLVLLVSGPALGQEPDQAVEEVTPKSPVGAAIEQILPRVKSIEGATLAQKGEDLLFYKGRRFEPAFSGSKGAKKNEKALIGEIEKAPDHGLKAADYHLDAIERLRQQIDEAEDGGRDDLLARLDILLADAFLKLAHDLECGRANPYFSTGGNQRPPRCDVDFVAILADAVDDHKVKEALEGLAPQTERYSRLKKALVKAREAAAQGSWPPVSMKVRKIEPGDTSPTVAQVRARLAAEGFIETPGQTKAKSRAEINEEMQRTSAEPGEDYYDDELVEAVKRFQVKYGLGEDGVIGKRTVLMMNREPSWRVCQVKINLDRMRALEHVIVTDRYAMVNIPEFNLTIFEGAKPIKEMKVIVGRLDRKSPLMSDNIRLLVFSPKWHVPTSIAVKDKLPKIKKDPSFIRRHGMTVYSVGDTGIERIEPEEVDWEAVNAGNFPYRLVQGVGDANALGRVKFLFPNRHAVYLHDTPTKYLFKRGKRTYSSGCIRISDPIWFAKYLLDGREGWDEERIKASMRRATPLHVSLEEHMPIHILYITAWGDEEGDPVFRHDVYGFDKVLAKQFCSE